MDYERRLKAIRGEIDIGVSEGSYERRLNLIRGPEPEPEPLKPSAWDKVKSVAGKVGNFIAEPFKSTPLLPSKEGLNALKNADITSNPIADSQVGQAAKSAVNYTGNNIQAGIGDFNYPYYKTLEAVGGDKIPILNKVIETGLDASNQLRAKGGNDVGSRLIRNTTSMVPNIILTLMTKGASLPHQLPMYGNAAILEATKQMATNPAFINSAIRSFGNTYGEATDEGADRLTAIRTGALSAIPQAMIEVSGGVEQLPKIATKEGLLKTIGKSAFEEGMEEIYQYPFEGLAKKATYAPETPLFSTKEQAVINPIQMGQAGLEGGLAGGLMGGAGKIANDAIFNNTPAPQIDRSSILRQVAELGQRPQANFYTDPYGNTAADPNYKAPLLLPQGPETPNTMPQTNFYADPYGNSFSDINQAPLLLQAPSADSQPFTLQNNKFYHNQLTPAQVEALQKRGFNIQAERMSDRLTNLNPPISQAEPNYSSAAGQWEAPYRVTPGELQNPLQNIKHPAFTSPVDPDVRIDGTLFQAAQEAAPAVEDYSLPNTRAEGQSFTANEGGRGRQAYTAEEQAELQNILSEDENYQSLLKELDGVDIESDAEIQTLAKTIKDKWGLTYNMTDIYRTMARQNPEFAKKVKADYLDPLDQSKGDYARGFTSTVQKVAGITKKYGIKKGSDMDKALMWYREGQRIVGQGNGFFNRKGDFEIIKDAQGKEVKIPKMEKYTLEDMKRELPNDWQKVLEADKELKVINDEYFNRINETLKKIYPNVEQQIEPWENALKDLEAQANTLSKEAYKSAKAEILAKIYKEKKGKRLDYRQNYYHHYQDVIEGFAGLQNIFDTPANIDPELSGISEFTQPKSKWASWMQRRGMGTYTPSAIGSMLKYIPSAEYAININPHISKFRNLAKSITEGTAKSRNANNMIQFLSDYADNLAGKTNNTFLDRFLTRNADSARKVPRAIKWVNNRVKGNLILGKFSSAINQLANIPAGIARVKDPGALTKAIGQTLVGNTAMEQSNFMAERFMTDVLSQFDTKLIQQPKKFAVWLLGAGDQLGTTYTWNAAYNKAVKANDPNPVKYADELTRSVVAGRGVGEVPLMQQASTFQLIAPFQLEVANLWHTIGDMVNEKDFGGIVIFMLASYMFNKIAGQVTGSSPLLDMLGAAEDALLEDDIYQSLVQGEFRFKDTTPGQVAGRMAGEVLSNIPLGQTIAAAVPEYPTTLDIGIGKTTIPSRQQLFGENDPTRFGSSPLIVKGIQDPLYKLALPWGGDQLKRTIQGQRAVNQGASMTNNGRMRFPIDDNIQNRIQAGLFGEYSLPEGRKYFDNGGSPLSEKQTEAVQRSDDPKAAYERFIWQKQIDKIKDEIQKIAKDQSLSQTEKDKRILELRAKITELRAAQ